MKPAWRTLAILIVSFLVAIPAQAKPVHKKTLAEYFGPFLPRHLNDCRCCHLPDGEKKEGDEEKPHNPFGHRLYEVRKELKKAGKDGAMTHRLIAVFDEDSDGDGVSNLIELLAGSNPGEAKSKPTAMEIARANKMLAAFKTRPVYPWKPFETVQSPAKPPVKNAAWVRNPIDAFIAAEHELRALRPRPEALRHVLVRRVYLDLIGLPPTRDELQTALDDQSADWYEKIVDRLLASPRHGERWGRHWMDVWRYVDYSNSALQDGWTGVPHMWRWRDWIVASLNADKGYDRMVQEMLAADELAPTDLEVLPATAYLARNKGNNRDAWLHDSVNHTTRAFLGITSECARCHDHLYDSLPQEEYYRLRAIFEPLTVRIDPAKDQLDARKDKAGITRVYDSNPGAKTFFYIRGVEQNPDKDRLITPGVPAVLGAEGFEVTPVTLPAAATMPHRHPQVIDQLRKERREEIAEARSALDKASGGRKPPVNAPNQETEAAQLRLQAAEAKSAALEAILKVETLEDQDAEKKDRVAWEEAATATDAAQRQALFLDAKAKVAAARTDVTKLEADDGGKQKLEQAKRQLGDAEKAAAKAEQAAGQAPTVKYQKRGGGGYARTSSGRRLALARWITSRQNPLAARVAVNHIWLRHFGQAFVPSVFDFGAAGQPASHPALLDWLAVEFMENGWSMKHLHRLIVTSSTYRLSATPDPANFDMDPDNMFLWRMPSRRMEAEVVRDSILYISGKLDTRMYGPELDTKLGLEVSRRSLYFRYTDSDYLKVMEFFDAPGVDDCYKRPESIVPQQALTLLNSDLAQFQSRLLARNLMQPSGDDLAKYIQSAFEQVLSRPATAAELDTCRQFVTEQSKFLEANKSRLTGTTTTTTDGTKASADPALRARENLIHLLLNHHDFVTIR
jgi:hypothetical protein